MDQGNRDMTDMYREMFNPTTEELGRVLLEMNELVPTENNLLGELEMQVIRWTTDCRR
jgi:hypothetical protein